MTFTYLFRDFFFGENFPDFNQDGSIRKSGSMLNHKQFAFWLQKESNIKRLER